ncbi:MAG: ATP-binding cassette domain-containing protein [Calditrichaeota bacterium]|nr:MAG: ATP-binding cassette domain-containing protein [Calditrichota bacterium]
MQAVVVDNVSKKYDEIIAVKNISLEVGQGEIFGLLGPNGAGKTSLMRMIMNIIVPDSGRIILWGDPFKEKHKSQIGYLPEERGLYPRMKLLHHLQFLGEMKGMSSKEARNTALQWLEKFNLADRVDRKIQDLSKGLQQKVQFIASVLHHPSLLILDEPFSGLDPVNTKFLKDILMEMKREGVTILLSTHLMEQAEKLCDRICLVNRGEVVLQGKVSEVKRKYHHNTVLLEYTGDGNQVAMLPGVEEINDYGNYMEIRLSDKTLPSQFFKQLGGLNIEVRRFEATETSLNQIFIDLVGETIEE